MATRKGPFIRWPALGAGRGGVLAAHLRGEVMLLQLPALPKVPGAHGVVQSPSPQFGAVVGNVYAAGPICVALELPMKAKQGGVNLGDH